VIEPPDTSARLSACDGLAGQASGGLTAVRWVEDCLDRIAARDPLIRAWTHLDPERARAAARDTDRSAPGSAPLRGLPIGVKDVIDVAAMPTRCNAWATDPDPVRFDAECIERVRKAGAIPVGKTVTTEFAFTERGPTVNPHDTRRTPGGSSSGSAAAVADFHVPVALTTQTGGSTIRPAAYCGVVGYKPPFGHVPTRGLHYLAPSMDHIGLHARSVADIARVATVLEARTRPADPQAPLRLVRLALPAGVACQPQVQSLIDRACDRLAASGIEILQQAPLEEFDRIDDAHRVLMAAEVARTLSRWSAEALASFSESLRSFIAKGRAATEDDLAYARARVARIAQRLYPFAEAGALLIGPATLETAPLGIRSTGNALLNRPWSLLGLGAITIPAGVAEDGLPVGLQIVDPHPSADRLFPTARFVENVLSTRTVPHQEDMT